MEREELRQAIEAGTVTVIDALPAGAYGRRHLPGAVNLPIEQLETDGGVGMLPDQDDPIVVYSTDPTCERAPGVAEELRERGYTKVSLYQEGIEGWVTAGLPVTVP